MRKKTVVASSSVGIGAAIKGIVSSSDNDIEFTDEEIKRLMDDSRCSVIKKKTSTPLTIPMQQPPRSPKYPTLPTRYPKIESPTKDGEPFWFPTPASHPQPLENIDFSSPIPTVKSITDKRSKAVKRSSLNLKDLVKDDASCAKKKKNKNGRKNGNENGNEEIDDSSVVDACVAIKEADKCNEASNLMMIASKLNQLDEKILMGIDNITKLADLHTPCIMEVTKLEYRQTFYGKKASLSFAYVNKDGMRLETKCIIPDRVAQEPTPLTENTVLVYWGLKRKQTGNGESYHHCKRVDEPTVSFDKMYALASSMRSLTPKGLEDYLNVVSLNVFKAGTVFGYDKIQVETASFRDKATVNVIMRAATAVDETGAGLDQSGDQTKRRVYLPTRFLDTAREKCPGVMIYKGRQNNDNNSQHSYHDCVFLSLKAASRFLESRQSNSDSQAPQTSADVGAVADDDDVVVVIGENTSPAADAVASDFDDVSRTDPILPSEEFYPSQDMFSFEHDLDD
jgi:hypothetical protein